VEQGILFGVVTRRRGDRTLQSLGQACRKGDREELRNRDVLKPQGLHTEKKKKKRGLLHHNLHYDRKRKGEGGAKDKD